jgi:hypothetical protein
VIIDVVVTLVIVDFTLLQLTSLLEELPNDTSVSATVAIVHTHTTSADVIARATVATDTAQCLIRLILIYLYEFLLLLSVEFALIICCQLL